MKKVVLALAVLALIGTSVYVSRVLAAPPVRPITFESGLTGVDTGEIVGEWLENIDTVAHNFRVVIRQVPANSTPIVVSDSGILSIAAGQGTHWDYALPSDAPGNDYDLEIDVDSHKMVPTMSVIPSAGGGVLRYWQAPSDFMRF